MPKFMQKILLALVNVLGRIKFCKSSCCSSECVAQEIPKQED